ncbi:hypothetical protein HH308_24560 [Gordonia sp. TBRC 11910]|uniref:Uncharacterized protein n=1 Tax=Gordonia asplenii TaxID=2725283 RepID=A0A848L0R3_9ACTN|nr:hypothetical protein [Gordonia asplenii]NMO04396.1 hypothetical protein [Gordonia asplenii]
MNATELAHAAELTKLARTLGVEEERLAFLAEVSPDSLKTVRMSVSDRLFDADGDKLKRIAAAAKLVPAPIAAKAAAVAFGPLLTAAIASSIEVSRGIAVAGNLRVGFLARVAAELDPRRCGPILSALPASLAGKVAAQLVADGEHITLGRFVGAISDDALRTAAREINDSDLLRVAFLLEDRANIDYVVDVVSDRLPGILAAAGDEGLWSHALGLLDAIGDEHRRTMGDLAAQLDTEVLADLIGAAHSTGAWATLLPVTRLMSVESLRVFASNPAVQAPDTVAAVMDAALADDMWLDLLPLAGELPTEPRTFLAGRIVGLDTELLDDLIGQADAAGQWGSLAPVVAVMSPEQVGVVLDLPIARDAAVVSRAVEALSGRDDVPADIVGLVAAHGRAVGAGHAAV